MSLLYEIDKSFDQAVQDKKNFIFIGEAGSGKSEIVLNAALRLAQGAGDEVDVFDMDQTKPLYRSRDLAEEFADKGVNIRFQDQYLDAPTAVSGVATSLMSDRYTLLDIGGGHHAARQAGAYAHILRNDDTLPVYVVNPYRPWSKNIESIDRTMGEILHASRLERVYLLGNPNLGPHTTAADFIEGVKRLDELFQGVAVINSACVRRELYDAIKNEIDKHLIPIDLYLTYEWVD